MARFYIWNHKTNEVIEDNSPFWVDCAGLYLSALGKFHMVDARAAVMDSADRYGRVCPNGTGQPWWEASPKGKEGFPKEFRLALLLLGVQ